MPRYPIIANCNYESSDDDADIHHIRKAAEAGKHTEELLRMLNLLEDTLAVHAEDEDVHARRACEIAERGVRLAYARMMESAGDAKWNKPKNYIDSANYNVRYIGAQRARKLRRRKNVTVIGGICAVIRDNSGDKMLFFYGVAK